MIEELGKKVACAVVFLAMAVGLVACGGDSGGGSDEGERAEPREELNNQRYAEEVTATMIGLSTVLQTVDSAEGPQDLDLNRKQLDRLGDQIRHTVDEFGAIDPPGDAQEGHDRILAALEDFSSKYSDVAEAIEEEGKPTEETFVDLRTAIFELQDQYLQAREILIDAGVELGNSQGS